MGVVFLPPTPHASPSSGCVWPRSQQDRLACRFRYMWWMLTFSSRSALLRIGQIAFASLLRLAQVYVLDASLWLISEADHSGEQMGSVLDAACCAGTCRTPTQIGSLDVNNVGISIPNTLPLASIIDTTFICLRYIVQWSEHRARRRQHRVAHLHGVRLHARRAWYITDVSVRTFH